jgi:hypothetical protein
MDPFEMQVNEERIFKRRGAFLLILSNITSFKIIFFSKKSSEDSLFVSFVE